MLRLTVPMLLGIVSMMLLGVVDMFFISMLGTQPLAAVSFTLPVTQIVVGIALGIGMSIGALASRLIGAGEHHRAARLITDSQLLALGISCLITLAGFSSVDHIFRLLGATAKEMPDINAYMDVWLLGTPLLILVLTGNNALRANGDIKTSAILSALLALVNGILDPLLIFGLGPFPELGIRGAALATVLSGVVVWVCSFYLLRFRDGLLLTTLPRLSTLLENWRELSRIAVPSIGANLMAPLAVAALTAIVAQFGPAAVAGFGVGSRIEGISLMVVYALSSTLPMFIGQNIGAGKTERAYRALMGCLRFSLVFQAGLYLLLLAIAKPIATAFSDNPDVVNVIRYYLLIKPLAYGMHGVAVLVMVSLNVLKRPRVALLVVTIRLACLYVPLAYAGSLVGGVVGMLVGTAAGNLIAGVFAFALVKRACEQEGLRA